MTTDEYRLPTLLIIPLIQIVVAVLLMIALLNDYRELTVLILIVFAILIGTKVWSRLSPAKIQHEIMVDKQRGFPDETFVFCARIRNAKILPVLARLSLSFSKEFQAAEVIREKLTLMLHQELPYGLTVQIERYAESDDGVTINAVIWVERDSQKGIVVGKGGAVLKRVGRDARLELKEQLGRSVHLELWVKVKSNWADSEQDLATLGYESP